MKERYLEKKMEKLTLDTNIPTLKRLVPEHHLSPLLLGRNGNALTVVDSFWPSVQRRL